MVFRELPWLNERKSAVEIYEFVTDRDKFGGKSLGEWIPKREP